MPFAVPFPLSASLSFSSLALPRVRYESTYLSYRVLWRGYHGCDKARWRSFGGCPFLVSRYLPFDYCEVLGK
ncbi:hypothetical protein BU24DRAFT_416889 [Aaosphaeria arxii CBS 175.79]|uniref:Uncharacterized protein n=1 Tax=Aaosphaeria arxii CBS 175.79 TaxID=1450172 RepID=A0A6A5Y6P8_9PLEO|nr:uncharacterized protein BU24DRAFT_416889 [Aaosphaeria arxii CBS 175.79]KAF2021232.1 hypothetical protein BU24DRAFT_416889 [Aaosphaeria arxii CBS 175.79]